MYNASNISPEAETTFRFSLTPHVVYTIQCQVRMKEGSRPERVAVGSRACQTIHTSRLVHVHTQLLPNATEDGGSTEVTISNTVSGAYKVVVYHRLTASQVGQLSSRIDAVAARITAVSGHA